MTSSEQRGFSLVEITVAVAIIAVVAASSVAFALASRPTALWAATTQFDSMVSAARSVGAAYGDGATIFVSSSPGPTNFRADLYAHRPSATASASPIPSQIQPIIAQVAISESQLLGQPPFAVIIHGNGDIGVRKNYSRGDPVSDAELPCPASNQLVFVFTVNGQTATRTISCHTPLAYTGTTTQKPPPGAGPTPTPWVMPSCDPSDNGCPIPPGQSATPPPCPAGTTLYNGVCRAPLVLTVTGPTAVGGQCDWTSTTNPCSFTLTEQYYPAPSTFTIISSPSSPCTANYSINNGSGPGSLAAPNSYSGLSPSGWSITPQTLDGSSCVLLAFDDRGPSDPEGSATLELGTASALCPQGDGGTPPDCYPKNQPPGPSPSPTPPINRNKALQEVDIIGFGYPASAPLCGPGQAPSLTCGQPYNSQLVQDYISSTGSRIAAAIGVPSTFPITYFQTVWLMPNGNIVPSDEAPGPGVFPAGMSAASITAGTMCDSSNTADNDQTFGREGWIVIQGSSNTDYSLIWGFTSWVENPVWNNQTNTFLPLVTNLPVVTGSIPYNLANLPSPVAWGTSYENNGAGGIYGLDQKSYDFDGYADPHTWFGEQYPIVAVFSDCQPQDIN